MNALYFLYTVYCTIGMGTEGNETSSSSTGSTHELNVLGQEDGDSGNRVLDIIQADPMNTFLDYYAATNNVQTLDKNGTTVSTSSVLASNISEEKAKLLQANVLEEGKATLERILTQNNITGSTGSGIMGESRAKQNQIYDLNLKSVTLLNFGPYGGDRVLYPLQKRYSTPPLLPSLPCLLFCLGVEIYFGLIQHYTALHYSTV